MDAGYMSCVYMGVAEKFILPSLLIGAVKIGEIVSHL